MTADSKLPSGWQIYTMLPENEIPIGNMTKNTLNVLFILDSNYKNKNQTFLKEFYLFC